MNISLKCVELTDSNPLNGYWFENIHSQDGSDPPITPGSSLQKCDSRSVATKAGV